jgi:hypothetical protein
MVVKQQETADANEAVALTRSGAVWPLTAPTVITNWTHQIIYIAAATGDLVALKAKPSWISFGAGQATQAAVATDGEVWSRLGENAWVSAISGATSPIALTGWTILPPLPAGPCLVSSSPPQVILALVAWVDSATGNVSAEPPSGPQIVTNTSVSGTYGPGLGPLIPTSQSYISARLLLATGGLSSGDATALQDAITYFNLPGPWTDVRQSLYIRDSNGTVILDPTTNLPSPNPLRTPIVAYQGELNDYYRQLVYDRGIDPFTSRTAEQFGIVAPGSPSTLSAADASAFMSTYMQCVNVFMAAHYEEAYTGDPLYLSWCRLYIAWMAIMATLDSRLRGFGNIDTMEAYGVTQLLYSYGMYDFDDMPVNYQRRLVKNINQMISDKGTAQVFTDILTAFGMTSEVQVWRHFLVRFFPYNSQRYSFPRLAVAGEAYEIDIPSTGTLGCSIGVTVSGVAASAPTSALALATLATLVSAVPGVLRARAFTTPAPGIDIWVADVPPFDPGLINGKILTAVAGIAQPAAILSEGPADLLRPNVGFARAPADVALSTLGTDVLDPNFLDNYEQFVAGDPTWEVSLVQAQALPISVLQTKYFSLTASLDAVANGLAIALLWGSLKEAQAQGRTSSLLVPGASGLTGVSTMTLVDAFVAMLILMLWEFNVDDIIPQGGSGVAAVLAARTDGAPFPGQGSLLPSTYTLARTADVPNPLSIGETVTVVKTNLATAAALDAAAAAVGRTVVTTDIQEVENDVPRLAALIQAWDTSFITAYTSEAWGSCVHWSDWLGMSNPGLLAWVQTVESSQTYSTGVVEITSLVEDAVASNAFNFSLAFGATDVILTYIQRLIMFFKAYTVDLHDFTMIMLVDRPATETVHLLNYLAGMLVRRSVADGNKGRRGELSWLWDLKRRVNLTESHSDILGLSDAVIITDVWPPTGATPPEGSLEVTGLAPSPVAGSAFTGATWDPTHTELGAALSEDLLTASGDGNAHARDPSLPPLFMGTFVDSPATDPGSWAAPISFASSGQTIGRWYYELTVEALNPAALVSSIGVAVRGAVGQMGSLLCNGSGGSLVRSTGLGVTSQGSGEPTCDPWGVGDVVGVAVDLYSRAVWYRVNGGAWNAPVLTSAAGAGYASSDESVWTPDGTVDPERATGGQYLGLAFGDAPVYPAVCVAAASVDSFRANFGGSAFAHEPPAGFAPGWPQETAVQGVGPLLDAPTACSIVGAGLSASGLQVSALGDGSDIPSLAQAGTAQSSGKYYFEVRIAEAVGPPEHTISVGWPSVWLGGEPYDVEPAYGDFSTIPDTTVTGRWGYGLATPGVDPSTWADGAAWTYLMPWTIMTRGTYGGGTSWLNDGSVVGVAADLDLGKVWYRIAGGPWIGGTEDHDPSVGTGGGDPAAGTGGLDLPDGPLCPTVVYGMQEVGTPLGAVLNLGGSAFAASPPAGFTPGWP